MNQLVAACSLRVVWRLANLFLCGLGFAALAVAAPAGVETKVVPADGVTRVILSTPGDLVIKPGSDEKLVIEAEAKVLAQLDVSARGGVLSLRSKGSFKTDKGLKYTLTVKAFRGLKTTAAGNSRVEGFSGGDIDIEAGGSNNIDLRNINAAKLTLVVADAGDISAKGSARAVVARVEGAGNIDAASCPAKTVDARVEGSGTILVNAEEHLKAVIDGAGNIEYKGAAKVSKTINGAGNIDRM